MPRILVPFSVQTSLARSSRHKNEGESHGKGAQEVKQSMTEQRKAVIKNADMSEDMQQEAVDCASQALSKYNIEKVSTERAELLHCIGRKVCRSVEYSVGNGGVGGWEGGSGGIIRD